MAKKITIRGMIGWSENATPEFLSRELAEANGDDVDLEFASGGGFVMPGLEMANMIRNYSGRVVARITGVAASMSSYIPMMADEVIAEDNAIFMIHNVMGGMYGGDFRDAEKLAKHLRALRDLLAKAYVDKTGKPLSEIQKLMDDETFYYGSEISDAGFADKTIDTDGDGDKDTAMALATVEIQECQAKMKESEKEIKADFEKAAAYLKIDPTKNQPAAAGKQQEEATNMASLKDFLAANSDAKAEYDADIKAHGEKLFAEGETAGKQVGKDEAKAVYAVAIPILSSAHYPNALKSRVTEKAQAGDVEAVNDFVAMYDMTAEGIATAAAIKEQGEETPAGSDSQSEAEKSQAAYKAKKDRVGGV